jgi:heat shock protein HslJ
MGNPGLIVPLRRNPVKHPNHRLLPILVAVPVALLFSSCAGPKAAPDESGRASSLADADAMSVSLEGTSWVLAELAGRSAGAGEPPTARFESGQVRGSDGCNRYSAPFTAEGSTIAVSPGMTTQMACPPEVMARAQAFRDALENARRFRIVDGRLELLSPDGATLMIMAAQSTSVVGTWEVVAFNNGREAVVGVLEQAPIEMTFDPDGTVAGSAGCNRFTGTFEGEEGAFRFGPAAATRRFCPGEGVMEQEQAFLNALATVATARMEGDGLEFRTADDALALMLRRLTDR